MPAPVYAEDAPIDERGLRVEVHHNSRTLVCPGCGAWVRTHGSNNDRVYKAQPIAMLQINHHHPCSAIARHLDMLREEHHGQA